MTIEINNESAIPIDETVLLRLMEYNLAELHVSADADVAIVLVDEGAMEALHVQWMDEPGPTDVLSFPMDELRPGTEDVPTPPGLLGDIVLCPQVAETQAVAAKHSTMDELILLTTHGLLHLLGFDHAEPDEEKEMFALQKDLIVGFQHRTTTKPRMTPAPPAARGGAADRIRRSHGGDRRGAGGDLPSGDRGARSERSQRAGAAPDRRRSRCPCQRGRLHQGARRDHRGGARHRRAARCCSTASGGRCSPPPCIMTGTSFVIVGASPRSWGVSTPSSCCRARRRSSAGSGSSSGRSRTGSWPSATGSPRASPAVRRSPPRSSSSTWSTKRPSQDLIEEDDRELIHSVFDFTDTFVRAVMVPAHRHGDGGCLGLHARRDEHLPREGHLARPDRRRRGRRRRRHALPQGPRAVRLTATRADGGMPRSAGSRGARCSSRSR